MSLLTEMFGQESLGAIAPLLQNMGNLAQAFDLVGDSAKYAGSMQNEFNVRAKPRKTRSSCSATSSPTSAYRWATSFCHTSRGARTPLGTLTDGIRAVVETPFGQWLVGAAGALAAGVIAVTAFSGAMWGFRESGRLFPVRLHRSRPCCSASAGPYGRSSPPSPRCTLPIKRTSAAWPTP